LVSPEVQKGLPKKGQQPKSPKPQQIGTQQKGQKLKSKKRESLLITESPDKEEILGHLLKVQDMLMNLLPKAQTKSTQKGQIKKGEATPKSKVAQTKGAEESVGGEFDNETEKPKAKAKKKEKLEEQINTPEKPQVIKGQSQKKRQQKPQVGKAQQGETKKVAGAPTKSPLKTEKDTKILDEESNEVDTKTTTTTTSTETSTSSPTPTARKPVTSGKVPSNKPSAKPRNRSSKNTSTSSNRSSKNTSTSSKNHSKAKYSSLEETINLISGKDTKTPPFLYWKSLLDSCEFK